MLGDGPLLGVEQAVVLETDPIRARELARTHTRTYTGLPNYVGNLRRLDPTLIEDDFAHGGSDRVVDRIVVWGDIDAVLARVQAHLDAGADHVCIQVVSDSLDVPVQAWRDLSAALGLATS